MTTKCTWLVNGSSGGNSFGFSETWYSGATGDAVVLAMDIVSIARAPCLGVGAEIVGYRIQDNFPTGRSYVVRKSFLPPTSNDWVNLPADAVLCAVAQQNSVSLKQFWIKCLPDNWISAGELSPGRVNAVRHLIASYTAANFLIRAVNPAAPSANVLSVDANGLVTTIGAHGMAANQLVAPMRMRDINGRTVRGSYIISSAPTATTLQLAQWPGNVVGRSGRLRVQQFTFNGAVIQQPDLRGIVKVGVRKVGRPFFQSRGRVSIRR